MKFGASTAAYQIEGATSEDGRGESIWDAFARRPGAIARGENGDVACDHYHRWRADLDLMAALGLESYRFSIAWPRVQPSGRGGFDARGIGFYRRLAAGLRERGIDPVATLYHADLPQALQDRGGWAARDTAERFAAYAGRMAESLGDVIGHWITHNEPWGVAFVGHAEGVKAPGLRDWGTAVQVAHHLLVSHGLALRAVRAARPDATVGIALNLSPVRPASGSEADAAAARRRDGYVNRWFLDPLLRGAYPADMRFRFGPFAVAEGDMATIAEPVDFLGINYYHPEYVRSAPAREPLGVAPAAPAGPTSSLGWAIDPGGLRELLARLVRDYGRRPVWITENGIPDGAQPSPCEDGERVDFLRAHLEALAAAVADGADVRRYHVWSLLDNFEWELGYAVRFGLVHVDFATQRRTPKRSALWYRDYIAARRPAASGGSAA